MSPIRGLAACMAACAISACASHHPESLADRLIKKGEPEIVIGDVLAPDPQVKDATPPRVEDLPVAPRAHIPAAGRLEDADPDLAMALLLSKAAPTPARHRHVAQIYQRHGVLDLAYDHLLAAERLAPDDAATQDQLARLWRAWKLESLGLEAASRAVALAPDSPEAHNTLGTLLHAAGNYTAARQAYAMGLALAPDAAYVMNNLCVLGFDEGHLEQARGACESAIAADPSLKEAYNNLAIIHFWMGNDALAWQVLQEAGEPSTALYNLGIAKLARGSHAEAARAFAEAAERRPGWSEAQWRARRALSASLATPIQTPNATHGDQR